MFVAATSGTDAAVTDAAPPPPGSAPNDLARMTKMAGPSPVNFAVTISLPPNAGCSLESAPSPATKPVTFVSTGVSSLADRRPAMSRPS